MSQTARQGGQAARQRSRDWSNWCGRISDSPLWQFILIALAVKAVILIADPSPQLFLGDSGSYLYTALTGWIPPDRSFLYGFLIRWLSVGSGSLFSLVLGQTLASAVSAGLVGWVSWRFIGTSKWLATAAITLYSLDPLQLLYERFVMAETFSLAAAMLFVSFLLLFVDGGRKRYLVWASVAGVVTVALRISFLPSVVALSFSAPVIRFLFGNPEQPESRKAGRKALLVSLAIVTICHFTLHTGYKFLNGRLSGAAPAYQYADGLSLLSAWCPVLTLADLQAAGVSERVIAGTAPRTLESRRRHRWMSDGVIAALNGSYDDPIKANALARKVAFHILRRDPIGVAVLGIRTYFRGWRRDVIKACIIEDTGAHRPVPPDLSKPIARHFHIAVDDQGNQKTLTKAYFRRGIQWYRILLLTPLLLILTTAFARRYRPFFLIVAIYASVALLTAVGLAVDNSIRYLHPLSWTFFLCAAYWTERVVATMTLKFRPPSVSS